MADQLLEQVRDYAEGQIDFEGQRLAELGATALLATAGVSITWEFTICTYTDNRKQGIAFTVGYFLQNITLALWIGLAGTAITFLIVVPPWPVFKRAHLTWLPVAGSEMLTQGIMVDGKLVS